MKHSSLLKYTSVLFFLTINFSLTSCNKYLDDKPVSSTVTINTIKDLQALLDNGNFTDRFVPLTTNAVDEYYLTSTAWSSSSQLFRDVYIWDKDVFHGAWSQLYQNIYTANVVLQSLETVKSASQAEKDYIKGQALFHRAFAFYQLAQVYCKPYSQAADSDPGIAIRLIPDIEEKSVRGTVAQTYRQIVLDLESAAGLLKTSQDFVTRPYVTSALGLLSRVYLSMSDYTNALKYSELYLSKLSALMDFNTLDSNANPVFKRDNIEISFFAATGADVVSTQPPIDSNLYISYDVNDLRRPVYFLTKPDKTKTFKGSYSGVRGYTPFPGICTDEIYLNRAECYARLGRVADSMSDLNILLKTRWRKNKFTPYSAQNQEDALKLILTERRKELVYRGTRWTDLRRLNLEGANISLKRFLNGIIYTLPPNDKRWLWLIPAEVISLTGMQQNER